MVVGVIPRTHQVDVFAWSDTAALDAHGNPIPGWVAAHTLLEVNIQFYGGSLQQLQVAREMDVAARMFVDRDVEIGTDPGVVVRKVLKDGAWVDPPAMHATQFRVDSAAYQGDRIGPGSWDNEFILKDAQEERFP